ncbi:unnamed protein product [Mortierella alpina]
MKFLRTRLASSLVVASTGSLALLAGVSGVNINPQTQGLYRRDHGPGHHEHHQHHHHRTHADHQHKHHVKGGKGKQGGPHHKAKDKHHKKPNMPTFFLVCSSLVVDSIQCPIRPNDPGPPPSCHAMNNGAAVAYINMQEPCSDDLPQMCSAEMAASLSDDTIEASGAKPNPAFKESCVAVKTKRHHAFKDLCVAVGDFCGNKLYGCDFAATTQYRCDAIGEHPRLVAENAASCGSTNACLCPASSTGLICGGELPKECKAYMNSMYDCSGGAGTTPKLSGHCEPGVLCRKDHELKDATCGSVNCECFGDKEVCSESFPAECDYEKNTIYRCIKNGVPVKMTKCAPKEGSQSSRHSALVQTAVLSLGLLTTRASMAVPAEQRERFVLQLSRQNASFPGTHVSNARGQRCNAKPNTVYYCPGGRGAKSKILTECKPGTICNKKEAPVGAACGGRICECPGNKEVCSYAFPDSSALDKNAIYSCTSSGSPTKTKSATSTNVFPQHCKIPTGSIYSCVKGQTPFPPKVCALGGCTAGSDKCDTDPCKCQENGDVCGSTFPKECQLPKDTLYSCTGKNATPMEKMACSNKGCVPTAGDDLTLSPRRLPNVHGAVMSKMDQTRATLSVVECPWGCDVKDGPDKCNTDCQCKDGDDVCGSMFPAKCGFTPNSLYKCSGALATPSSPAACPKGCDIKIGPDTCGPTGTSPAATTDTSTGTSAAATTRTSVAATTDTSTGTSAAATTRTSVAATTDSSTGTSPAATTDTPTGTSPAATTGTPTGTSPAATPTCMAESGHIVDRITNFCVGVDKLVDQEPVVTTNCTGSTGYVNWRLSEGRMKSDDNQFCLGYHYNANGAVSPMVLMSCNSTDSTIVGWSAVNANILTAVYLATGLDPAQVVESFSCITLMKAINIGNDLLITFSMPSIEVGTVGGGTSLPPQAAMLDLLGVRGSHPEIPGANVQQLARMFCAGVMAGELSLCAALAGT